MKNLPWTLYRYIGKELLTSFLLCILSLSLLITIVTGFKAVQQEFSLLLVLPWVWESLPFFFYYTVPASLLVAGSLVTGRFASDREYTACCALGISPLHLYVPMFTLAGLLCILAFATQGKLLPRSHYINRNIARYFIKQLENLGDRNTTTTIALETGKFRWERSIGSHLFGVSLVTNLETESDKKDETTGKKEKKTVHTEISAGEAFISTDKEKNEIVLSLHDVQIRVADTESGVIFNEPGWPKHFHSGSLDRFKIGFPVDEKKKREGDLYSSELRVREAEKLKELEELNKELASTQDEATVTKLKQQIKGSERRVNKIRTELWSRWGLALSVLSFGLLGIPLSLLTRYRGRLVGFFCATMCVIIFYYPLQMAGESLAKAGTVPAWLALMAGNFVLFLITLIATGKLIYR